MTVQTMDRGSVLAFCRLAWSDASPSAAVGLGQGIAAFRWISSGVIEIELSASVDPVNFIPFVGPADATPTAFTILVPTPEADGSAKKFRITSRTLAGALRTSGAFVFFMMAFAPHQALVNDDA